MELYKFSSTLSPLEYLVGDGRKMCLGEGGEVVLGSAHYCVATQLITESLGR